MLPSASQIHKEKIMREIRNVIQGNTAQDLRNVAEKVDEKFAGTVAQNTTYSVGTDPEISGLTITELGDGAVHKTIFDFDEMEMTVTDGTTPATDGAWGTLKLYTFPKGYVQIIGSYMHFPEGGIVASSEGSGLVATADFEIGVGTEASANHSSFVLGATEDDIVSDINIDLDDSKSDAAAASGVVDPFAKDGTSTAGTINLNVRTEQNDDSGTDDSTLTISGRLVVTWSVLGT
jgi:hypothetical protein